MVLDPFNGGGTTGVACARIGGRYYLGIEVDRAFCELSQKRFRDTERPAE
ncbi:MAG: site-specific DNA-methyltransferase [Spirochaetaceae bacterium]|nr:site-specific DNA-methyltransferase [Spirochaetaceae bacterium]